MNDVPSWARKGVKVVCIDAAERPGPGEWTPIESGRTYTIRAVSILFAGQIDLVLAEITRPLFFGLEPGYAIERFRPLVADKSESEDVALFEHHLA
jgi:hypothetical protein